MKRFLLFTDLDGTLLALADYDWRPAAGALEALRRRRVPVVIATSKTRAEIELWRRRLGIGDPFISENGGALYVPEGTPLGELPGAKRDGEYLKVEFGAPYRVLREALPALAERVGVRLRGFGDLSREEVAGLTGLDGEDLDAASAREHDEPFVAERALTAAEQATLQAEAEARGLRVSRGGRFGHLLGPTSKGRAARLLSAAYAAGGEPMTTLALGDGPNDLELLLAVDRPIVVARPDGSHAPELTGGVPHARFARGAGPEGFAESVLEWLERPW